MTSIIIPAHNEEHGIQRLLSALVEVPAAGEFEVLVICNGCTDRTYEVAAGYSPPIVVINLEGPSKARALKKGDSLARSFPRIYVDADVEIDAAGIRALVRALDEPGVEAAAPRRIQVRRGVSWAANWYYDIWEQLPGVTAGLFGRGVIALSSDGFERIQRLPEVMSDDLALSEAFDVRERRIEPTAEVLVHPAQTWRSLVERRVRVITGTQDLRDSGLARPRAGTTFQDLWTRVRTDPASIPKVVLFMVTTAWAQTLARKRSRAGLQSVWSRDETSRG